MIAAIGTLTPCKACQGSGLAADGSDCPRCADGEGWSSGIDPDSFAGCTCGEEQCDG